MYTPKNTVSECYTKPNVKCRGDLFKNRPRLGPEWQSGSCSCDNFHAEVLWGRGMTLMNELGRPGQNNRRTIHSTFTS
uniref:Uncharacterized protein n=1 Tax=Anguilla anguilla TaxID=7936 RepID=A0A0E9WX91_ANGAN